MIYVSVSEISRIESQLGAMGSQARVIVSRALKRAAENVATNITKQAQQEYHVTSSEVRRSISIYQSSSDAAAQKMIVKSRATRRELIGFKVSPQFPRPKNPPKSVRVAVSKKGGLKELPGAFLALGTSSGSVHILKRLGKSRYPLHIKYGPSVPEMIGKNMTNRQYRVFVETEAQKVYETRLLHEIERALGGDGN